MSEGIYEFYHGDYKADGAADTPKPNEEIVKFLLIISDLFLEAFIIHLAGQDKG